MKVCKSASFHFLRTLCWIFFLFKVKRGQRATQVVTGWDPQDAHLGFLALFSTCCSLPKMFSLFYVLLSVPLCTPSLSLLFSRPWTPRRFSSLSLHLVAASQKAQPRKQIKAGQITFQHHSIYTIYIQTKEHTGLTHKNSSLLKVVVS